MHDLRYPGKSLAHLALNEEQSRPFVKKALELGINFFDTANVYSGGASEEVLGRTLRDIAKRDEVVVATKVYGTMRPEDPNGRGLSRKAILTEVDAILRRLGMDYVDLYQIHRWDYETPIEETLEALHDVIKAGKARYLGASSMFAWQFCKALHLASRHGWTRFVSMQPHYNLLYREEEREMLGLCQAEGVGVLPWSPLTRGRLTRPWETQANTERARTDQYGKDLYGATQEADKAVVDQLGQLSETRGLPQAQVCFGLVAAEASGDRAHRGRHQTSPSRGRRGRPLGQVVRGGDQVFGKALPSSPAGRV